LISENPVSAQARGTIQGEGSHPRISGYIIRVFSSQIGMEKPLLVKFEREINTIVFLNKLISHKAD
jgi:hypothetical protein